MFKNLPVSIFFVMFAVAPTTVFAQFNACRDYFPLNQLPRVANKDRVRDICFDSFAVLYSGERKTPIYAVERLNRTRLIEAKKKRRTDKFYAEARLPFSDRATLDDYRGSGYDRGHQAPAGDMPNPNAMAQSFSLANVVPQARKNNQGIWARNVENATRRYVMRAKGDVFVFTGPVFEGQVRTIGAGRVWVPTHLFKLVYDPNDKRAWAYWVENSDYASMSKPISYRELVARTGIEFLPGVELIE